MGNEFHVIRVRLDVVVVFHFRMNMPVFIFPISSLTDATSCKRIVGLVTIHLDCCGFRFWQVHMRVVL